MLCVRGSYLIWKFLVENLIYKKKEKIDYFKDLGN